MTNYHKLLERISALLPPFTVMCRSTCPLGEGHNMADGGLLGTWPSVEGKQLCQLLIALKQTG